MPKLVRMLSRVSRLLAMVLCGGVLLVVWPPAVSAADARPARANTRTTPPVPIVSAPPPYPASLSNIGVTGVVVVEFIVNTKGRVEKPAVLETSHEELSKLTLETLKKWRFRPATIDEKPVAVRLRQTFTFGSNALPSAPPAAKP